VPQVGASVSLTGTNLLCSRMKRRVHADRAPGTYAVRVEAPGAFPLEKVVNLGAAPASLDFQVAEDKIGEVINILGRARRVAGSRLGPGRRGRRGGDQRVWPHRDEPDAQYDRAVVQRQSPGDHRRHRSHRPGDLRSLGPEHVLVLVNGKRLHQSSLVTSITAARWASI